MPIGGRIATVSKNDDRARGQHHPPVIRTGRIQADSGEYPMGLILARNASDEMVPYEETSGEVLGTGDGSAVDFSAMLASVPAQPGSVRVTDGVETFRDDGLGNLIGDAGGTGTVIYENGSVSVSFNSAPANQQDVTASYGLKIAGVLDDIVDSSKATAGNYVVHGSVRRDVLKVGQSSQSAPDAELLTRLQTLGIFPE